MNQPSGFFPHHGVLSSDGTLYITYSNDVGPSNGNDGSVWKYRRDTATWTNITPPKATNEAANGFGGISVDAANPQTLVVASLNLWWPDGMLWRSRNGGTSWSPIWTSGTWPNRTLKYRMDVSEVPWLNFGMKEDSTSPAPAHNSDRIFWGTGATLYTSSDLTNWDRNLLINIKPMIKGVENTAVQDLISPPSGTPHLLSAIGDLGGFRHDDIKTIPQTIFTNPIFTLGRVIDFAELAPQMVAMVGKDGNQKPIIGFSEDQGATWKPAGILPIGMTGPGSVAVAADGAGVVWAPDGGNVYVTSNKGTTWTTVTGITASSTSTIHLAADRKNAQKIYAFADGKFYTSTNQGKTFTMMASLPTWGIIASKPVKAVPGYEGDIWISMGSAGLYRSTDSGKTFVKAACCSAAYTIGFGKAAPGSTYPALYIYATADGVDAIFRSDDKGVTWLRVNDDAHQYADPIFCITGDPRVYGRVYVCTNGYGIPVGRLVDEAVEDTGSTDTTSASVIYAGNGLGTGWGDSSYAGMVTYDFAGPPIPVVGSSIIKATLEPYGGISLRSSSSFASCKTIVAYIAGNGTNISVRLKVTAGNVESSVVRLTSTATTGTRCEKAISQTGFSPCKIDIEAFGAKEWDRVDIINNQNAGGVIYVSHFYLSTVTMEEQ
ncbi:hypothetical protein HK097_010954 [Rhizophlyctis rosea]|uniref:Glycoside hydrolase family 74 n=1 Tax=Rhizophlyctis rosea TaxID=64517 RepID=A0AAD5SIG2_9FUNG|nr:hypothetical protein HK097_010954 [Rhizophlyctis rosea]